MKYFTVPQVPGSQRQSEHRTYTHAVIAQVDYDAHLAGESGKIQENDKKNWQYNYNNAITPVGEKYPEVGFNFKVTAEMSALGKERIAKYPNPGVYAEALRDQRIVGLRAKKEKNEGCWVVLQWSQSLINASKGASSYSNKCYKHIKVVETVEVIKNKKIIAA